MALQYRRGHGLGKKLLCRPYTADEAERTRLWVRSGGLLIYASEQGDPELDRALGVRRLGGYTGGGVLLDLGMLIAIATAKEMA